MYLVHKSKGIPKHKKFINVEWHKITSIYYLIFVFGKSVLTPQKLIGSFILILIFAIGSSAMMPYYFSYGTTANLSLFLISSFIYGSICYSFHKSTLFENIKGTSLSKYEIYFSILVIVTLFSVIMYLFILAFFTIGLSVNSSLFTNAWFSSTTISTSSKIMLGELNFKLLIWWYFAYILINFSLFYLFQNLSNNQTTFYLLVFFYFILLMIFGNAVNVVMLNHEYSVTETYPYLDAINYSYYIEDVNIDLIFSIPDNNFPISPSMQMSVSNSLKDQWVNDRYFYSLMTLFTPHYWINFYCTNVMKATSLTTVNINPLPGENLVETLIGEKIDTFNIDIVYSPTSFESIEMWTFSNELAWILGMYLWIIYSFLIMLIGLCFSSFLFNKNKKQKN